ncbi:MAG: tRNA adenylyl-/cytidylyl-transferase [Candidatus Roizmanbacteria bacterium GW2011_GWA2_33_33]|uniref:tRNA adenylyl-/cytidylyl-transferase n=2 Tax=Candidatus Roizmaniibacteriota TaxID=1752723 RepID=A0A0G0B140_9BACT|nr:MAG: tRNA adenylyl-/cytidylyl-transferase [Candidatus Roizmanbacteria bacterium GW2011_GWA2_33_33]KKP63118.1 MAG: tRNA adenylyl-/cytidylyl-transferase [Candidatus Roizmanbacteria bacterium GW2011_GWC2_34_23]
MIKLPKEVVELMKKFKESKFQIYVVGGAVRDTLLNKPVDNWDFTTNATPEQILKMFPDAFYNNVYGTVTVPIKNEQSNNLPAGRQGETMKQLLFEITPFRKESGYSDLRHPEKIEWAKTIEEDLSRRDFTINSMAFDGSIIIDPYKGMDDLKNKLIKAVGEPDKRFNEDVLRLLRAIRFTSQLGFLIEDKTRESIQKNALLIAKISWERIRDEFLKILNSDHPAEGIFFLKSTGLLSYILPEVDVCFTIPQKSPKRHHIYDVGTHLVMALKHCPSKDLITRFATLIHDIGKAKTFYKDEKTDLITFYNHEVVGKRQAEKIADRFKLSNKQKDKLVTLVAEHQFTVSEDQTDKAVRRFIRGVSKEYLNDMLDLRTADRIGSGATPTSWRTELFKKRLEEVQKQPFQIKDLKIDGNDVMKILKIKPGPKIGEVLKDLFDQVVEGKLKNTKKILIEEVEKLALKQFTTL